LGGQANVLHFVGFNRTTQVLDGTAGEIIPAHEIDQSDVARTTGAENEKGLLCSRPFGYFGGG